MVWIGVIIAVIWSALCSPPVSRTVLTLERRILSGNNDAGDEELWRGYHENMVAAGWRFLAPLGAGAAIGWGFFIDSVGAGGDLNTMALYLILGALGMLMCFEAVRELRSLKGKND